MQASRRIAQAQLVRRGKVFTGRLLLSDRLGSFVRWVEEYPTEAEAKQALRTAGENLEVDLVWLPRMG